jgi:septal ring factor EnvC (AmiA/AmiB activator)
MNQLFTNNIYILPTMVTLGFLVLLLLVLLIVSRSQLRKKNKLLEEKEEKITYLRQVSATNEYRITAIEHETEKEIIDLKHTIEGLEKKINEGTKSQVVNKLEAQQNKRARALNRVGL